MTAAVEAIDTWRWVSRIVTLCGDEGSERLQELLRHVERAYRVLSPDQLVADLSIAVRLDEHAPVPPLGGGSGEVVPGIEGLSVLLGIHDPIVIEVHPDGTAEYWVRPQVTNLDGRLVYVYRGPAHECFLASGAEVPVPNQSGQLSQWAIPYFRSLEEALNSYSTHAARLSQCPILSRAWQDGKRLVFAAKPEHHMRDSLVFALRNTLRDVEVMPEQNVDVTGPVDIKVRWTAGQQVALIEVKWLGKSLEDGQTQWSSQYGPSRAVDGLRQLCNYLDRYHTEALEMDARGYVVVFDGRRRCLQISNPKLSRHEAYYYRDDVIEYPPDLLSRSDVAHPVRFFLEPDATGVKS